MSRKITLKISTGETFKAFEIDEAVAFQSKIIKNFFDDNSDETVMTIPDKVSAPVLAKVIEYCKKHDEETDRNELLSWVDDFFALLNKETLFDVVKAANYLCIPKLLNDACYVIAHRIRDFTPEEVKAYYRTRDE